MPAGPVLASTCLVQPCDSSVEPPLDVLQPAHVGEGDPLLAGISEHLGEKGIPVLARLCTVRGFLTDSDLGRIDLSARAGQGGVQLAPRLGPLDVAGLIGRLGRDGQRLDVVRLRRKNALDVGQSLARPSRVKQHNDQVEPERDVAGVGGDGSLQGGDYARIGGHLLSIGHRSARPGTNSGSTFGSGRHHHLNRGSAVTATFLSDLSPQCNRSRRWRV
jgi:hypothetical protein